MPQNRMGRALVDFTARNGVEHVSHTTVAARCSFGNLPPFLRAGVNRIAQVREQNETPIFPIRLAVPHGHRSIATARLPH
jgi:hypothetical protein